MLTNLRNAIDQYLHLEQLYTTAMGHPPEGGPIARVAAVFGWAAWQLAAKMPQPEAA